MIYSTFYVIFSATLAQTFDTFWVGVESDPVQISKRGANDPLFDHPNQPHVHTTPLYEPRPVKENVAQFDPFYEGCAVTKLCFGAPAECVATKSCKAVSFKKLSKGTPKV